MKLHDNFSHHLGHHQKKFKADSCYTGRDYEADDFKDFTMNKGFIQTSVIDCYNGT